jgi:hypothetical protein
VPLFCVSQKYIHGDDDFDSDDAPELYALYECLTAVRILADHNWYFLPPMMPFVRRRATQLVQALGPHIGEFASPLLSRFVCDFSGLRR